LPIFSANAAGSWHQAYYVTAAFDDRGLPQAQVDFIVANNCPTAVFEDEYDTKS
jgi:hypothetical protein